MLKKLFLIITILITAVIFIHSSIPAVESTVQSDAAFNMLDNVTTVLHLPNLFTEISIRKLAHFTEFAVYGFFLSATVKSCCGSLKKDIFKILFFLLSVPVIDETIQYFPKGRCAQVSDILLDFSGGLFGVLCLAIIVYLFAKFKSKKQQKRQS